MDPCSRIRQFLTENFLYGAGETLTDDNASLVQSGIVDSTGILELVAFVEESFEMRVRDEEIIPANFDSVNQILMFVQRKSAVTA